jgi:hypothetical protein
MKCYQILALLTIGSCALITADTPAAADVAAAVPATAEQEFALVDEQEKNRMLGGYTEDDGYSYGGSDDDYGKGACIDLFCM